MKPVGRLNRIAVILFTLTLALFALFFAYMGTSERVSVFHPEQTHSYAYLTDFEKTLEYDETAPAGVVKVYRSVLAPELSKESCLVFNIAVHVGQEHGGETVTVILTPLFEASVSKEPQFLLGSHYAMAMDVLWGELPLMVLSAMRFIADK